MVWAWGSNTIGNSYSVSTSPAPVLGQINMSRMADPEMPGESIVPTKCLLLGTQMTPHLLLPRIVDGVFVSCEIVWSRENCVAGFAS